MQTTTQAIYCAILIACLGACSDPAQDDIVLQLSYEAIPGVGVALPQGTVDTSGSDYGDKLAFTQDVFDMLVPQIMDGLDTELTNVTTELAPGGFLLETNPSMQTRVVVSDLDEGAATADRLAAALGYTMYQWSVLVTDFSAVDGDTGYLIVRFSETTLTPDLAQEFFVHAASVDSGLGGGYMAYENDMIFLNVRDDTGVPYSGLDDETFVAGLEQAAGSFTPAEVVVLESGLVDARFVGNDWDSAAAGEEYLSTVGPGANAWLDPLQDSFAGLIDDAAIMYGWTVTPQALRSPAEAPGIRRGYWRELPMVGALPGAMGR